MGKYSNVTYIIHVNGDDGTDATVKFIVSVSYPRRGRNFGVIAGMDTINKANSHIEGMVERLRLEAEGAAIDCPFTPRIWKVYGVSLHQRSDQSTYLMCEVGVIGLGDTYSQAETTVLGLLDGHYNSVGGAGIGGLSSRYSNEFQMETMSYDYSNETANEVGREK